MFWIFKKKEVVATVVPVIECDCKEKQQEYNTEIGELKKAKSKAEKDLEQLQKDLTKAKADVKEAQHDKKLEIENIKHMQKMLDEKNALEVEKKIFEGEKLANEKVEKIKDEVRERLEKDLKEERKEMAAVMTKVMDALPNVNARLKA
jgi:DNA repair exonuclease SbcCD ATPase subunit